MIEQLIEFLGKSIENEAIKGLFSAWGVEYPKTITCTANNDSIKTKMIKDGVKLYFGRGANSRYLKPIPAKRLGSYIAIFTMIEFTKKCKVMLPFGVKFDMKPAELTEVLGEPKIIEFVGTTTTWRKNISNKHEFIVSDMLSTDGFSLRSMTVSFIYEHDLYTMEEYEKARF